MPALGREYAFIMVQGGPSAKIHGQRPVTNLHRPPVSLRATGSKGRKADLRDWESYRPRIAETGGSLRDDLRSVTTNLRGGRRDTLNRTDTDALLPNNLNSALVLPA
jgi:hypothetical protein